MRLFYTLICLFISSAYVYSDEVDVSFKKAYEHIDELIEAVRGQPDPKELRWNRYITQNFEILSLDDAQGKYLCDNIEFMKTWILWRWGMRDINFKTKCKLICVPSIDLYEKLFNRKTAYFHIEKKNGNIESNIWIVTDGKKWNTDIPVVLTSVVLSHYESTYNTRFPVWTHRGMSVLNGRISDIRAKLPLVKINTKTLFETSPEVYDKLSSIDKQVFDAQAASFCLMVRNEFNGKVFLEFLSKAMVNPQQALLVIKVNTFDACNLKLQTYVPKLITGSDYYLTW